MRETNAIVYKILTCFISVLLLGYLAASANAGTGSKPATPTNLSVSSKTNTTVTLSWTASSGATSYKVYKNGSLSSCATSTASPVQITGLTPNTLYTFKVSAVNSQGESTQCTAISVTTPPATPTNLSVSSKTNTTVTLSWTASSGATSYKVYKSGSSSSCATPSASPVQITGLTPNTLYTFTVSAVNSQGESTQCTAISVTTPPATPTNLSVSSKTNNTVTLSWTASSGATSYKVYKSGSSSSCSTPSASPVQITGLTANTAYTFTVSAVNSQGESTQCTAISVTTLPTVPATPTGLAVSAITQTSATLTWTATTGATSYNVYENGTLYSSPTTNTAPITGLTGSTTYSFTVSAVNAGGQGTQSTALPVTTLQLTQSGPTLKVLEVQPGTTYDLTTSLLHGNFPNNTIIITQMSMPEFISKVDEINGQYDIVYIGNNTSGASYTALGAIPTWLPVCVTPTRNGSGTNSQEYYSENDITNRRAATLKDFITSKQLTIFDNSIFNLGSKFKLYNNFNTFIDNTTYPNFKTVITSSNKSSNLTSAFNAYSTSARRPSLILTGYPSQYDGSDTSYSPVNYLGYAYNISTLNNAAMHIDLYIDVNGDGIFSNLEIVSTKDYNSANVSGSINYPLPNYCIGGQPWKLAVTDKSTGAKSYTLGNTAFKATTSEGALKIRVLQLVPNGNTMPIYDLHNIYDPVTQQYVNLLSKDKVFSIDVTEMNVTDFNAAYASLQTDQKTPSILSKNAKFNGSAITTGSTVLNGNYDMVIMGFADSYGGNDLNANAIQALQRFIDTNQSVMFTHDTMQYHLPQDTTDFPGTYTLTNSFRQLVGQQRYYKTNEMVDSSRLSDPLHLLYDAMPDTTNSPQKYSYGYSNRLFDRFKTDGNRVGLDTTTSTYKVNENLITQFPYPLGDIPVATTHYQWYQLDLEDPNVVPVYTLYDKSIYNNRGDGRNDYYTYSKGTITYSGTGHSKVNADAPIYEEKMFVNTMLKASRGANHAPTLAINGISENMNIHTSPSINFSFTATDTDPKDQYLNTDIYLSTSTDGITFIDSPISTQHFYSIDKSVTSGVSKSVIIPTLGLSIKAYKVTVVVKDSYSAEARQEIKLFSDNDPSITVTSLHASACLVGDIIDIPVTLTAQPTLISKNFTNINLQGVITNPDKSTTIAYNPKYPELPNLAFNPAASWTSIPNNYKIAFGTRGVSTSAGTYIISNQLSYTVNNDSVNTKPNPTTSSIMVYSGTIDVDVTDGDNPITAVSLKLVDDKNGSIVATGTTTSTGYFEFTGLSSGDYTVTVDKIPDGRTLEAPSKKVNLSVANHTQPVDFTMGGDLIQNTNITSRTGASQMDTIPNTPLWTNIGFKLTRPAIALNLALKNSLIGSTMNVGIEKVYCDDREIINCTMDYSIPGKVLLSQADTPFPSGMYKFESIVTIGGVTTKIGDSFTVFLTTDTSAIDENTTTESKIVSESPSLTVNVVSSPKLH